MNIQDVNFCAGKIHEIKLAITSLNEQVDKINGFLAIHTTENARDNWSAMERARLSKEIYGHIKEGRTLWEICEIMAPDYDGSMWRAFDDVSIAYTQIKGRQTYAKGYLIKAMFDNGYKFTQIAKVAGYTPQRCSQILRKWKG